MPVIDLIAGARPNFMKVASIIRALEHSGELEYRLVHTGQHYDSRMSGDFFDQLGIPEPHVNLEVGSAPYAAQAGAIMARYEALLLQSPSDLCVVVGDVTSTMACAITARQHQIAVAHVEAGLRSGDRTMPEEINRIVTDAVTDLFFTTSEHANAHLRRAGVAEDKIHFVGNTMVDTLLANLDRLRPPAFWHSMALEPGGYLVVTLHRPANVDDAGGLLRILQAIDDHARGLPVVFPVHPRTAKSLQTLTGLPSTIRLVDPQPYLEFNFLVRHAKAVITDSGGVTEETTVLGVPCLTMRDSTERPETVDVGTNELVGTNPAALGPVMDRLFAGGWKKGQIPDRWDGRAGERIVAVLRELFAARSQPASVG